MFLLASVAVLVAVADQLAKGMALTLLEPGRFVPFLGSSIGWQLIFNPGAAFGLRLPPVVFPVVTIVLIVVVLRALPEAAGSSSIVAQGLVVGGAIGNVIDRLVRPGDDRFFGGHVVDYVAWGTFPRFNVADASITVGVVLFVLVSLMADLSERRRSGSDA
jgi:signal peptidase II